MGWIWRSKGRDESMQSDLLPWQKRSAGPRGMISDVGSSYSPIQRPHSCFPRIKLNFRINTATCLGFIRKFIKEPDISGVQWRILFEKQLVGEITPHRPLSMKVYQCQP